MTDLRKLLAEVYHARTQELAAEGTKRDCIARIAKRLRMQHDLWGDAGVIRAAEAECAPYVVTGDAEQVEDLLVLMREAYIQGAQVQAWRDAHRVAVERLAAALRQLPQPPPEADLVAPEEVVAIAERIVCQEWLGRRLTAPLPTPSVTDSDGRPIKEAV